MSPASAIETSCLFIEGHQCYEVVKDFSSVIVAIVIFAIGFGVAWWKLTKQHKDTLKQQDEDLKKRFKIEFFNETNTTFISVSDDILDVATFCRVKIYTPPDQGDQLSYVDFLNIEKRLSDALLKVILRVESHEIVHPLLFQTFRYGLQSIHHDLLELRKGFSVDEALPKIVSLCDDTSALLMDFQVCLQNMTWGSIFDTIVESRKPIDKSHKVIVDDIAALTILNYYYFNESAWGISMNKINQEVEEKFASQ